MQKKHAVLTVVALICAATFSGRAALGQGFGDYVAPTANAQNSGGEIVTQTARAATQAGVARAAQATPRAQATAVEARSSAHSQQSGATLGGYVASDEIASAIVNPPENFAPTAEEQAKLDEFLTRWEDFGKGIKRVSCDVHMRDFDGVLQQNNQRPTTHTWGQFRYIAPNKLMYHIKGEFVYSDAKPKGEWKESQNEWKIVLNSKELVQYDYKNKNVVVYPIADEEQDMDLTMDNGQFPLFFVAKANVLKSRFYMRMVTPKNRQQDEVWIEAFPRYARDAQQFKSIVVILSLKDLQPTYMRKVGVNGKSKTDLTFENVAVNKGVWTIEGSVEPGWTKDVREEKFSIMRQQPTAPEPAQTQRAVAQRGAAQQQALAQQQQAQQRGIAANAAANNAAKRQNVPQTAQTAQTGRAPVSTARQTNAANPRR